MGRCSTLVTIAIMKSTRADGLSWKYHQQGMKSSLVRKMSVFVRSLVYFAVFLKRHLSVFGSNAALRSKLTCAFIPRIFRGLADNRKLDRPRVDSNGR